ncbi:Carbonic anhydrase 9, partial [Fragariocoptes setiger]
VDDRKTNLNRNGRSIVFSFLTAGIPILCLCAGAIEISVTKEANYNIENDVNIRQSVIDEWNYAQQNNWDRVSAECGINGQRQSPIDVITKDTVYDSHLSLELIDYDQPVDFIVKNTHHSVELKPVCKSSYGVQSQPPAVRLYTQNEESPTYELVQIHFHWGDKDQPGSEHLFDNHRSAAEMHLVHKRANCSDANSTMNSMLVIGVMIEEEPVENERFQRVVEGVHHVNDTDNEYLATISGNNLANENHQQLGADLQEFKNTNNALQDLFDQRLMGLLPPCVNSFYMYNGSLTTPPCHEVVTWVLMRDPIFMGQQQLDELTNLYAPRHGKISSNHRHIQPLGERLVYTSFSASKLPMRPLKRPWLRRWSSENTRGRNQSRTLLNSLGHLHINLWNLKRSGNKTTEKN